MMSLCLPSSVSSPPRYSCMVHILWSSEMEATGMNSKKLLSLGFSLSKGGLTRTTTRKLLYYYCIESLAVF